MRHTALAVCVSILVLTAAAVALATPGERLWRATAEVESKGDAKAYNRREAAAGIVQIRPTCLRDVNRIARLKGLDVRFSYADRYSVRRSRRMWKLYLQHYGEQYREATGREPSDMVYARIWNGGPKGYRKRATLRYWRRVFKAMKDVDPTG